MSLQLWLALVGGGALASLVSTILVRRWAAQLGLVDLPDGHRKLHRRPIPLGGGVAVWLAMLAVIGTALYVPNPARDILATDSFQLIGLLAAGSAIVVLGLADDRFKLRGRHKLLGQIAAAGILAACGFAFNRVSLFGWEIDLGIFGVPFALFWLVGAINAINLLDGIDGLATTLGIILSLTIGAMALLTHQTAEALIALVFAGTLLGFLPLNFPPASVFLGDAGSMLIGLVVGALAIQSSLKGPGTVLLAAPLGVWTIPLLDTLAAILRRKLTGRSIYTTDRSHLHHRLLILLGSNLKVLACVALFCAITSAAGLASLFAKNDLIALVASLGVVTVLVATGIFGRAEFSLVFGRLKLLGQSLFSPLASDGAGSLQHVVRLQGSLPWDRVWSRLTDSAEDLGLNRICLDVHLPAAQEEYHATWDHPFREAGENGWRLQMPLTIAGKSVGTLMFIGDQDGFSARQDIERLLAVLEPVESELAALAEVHAGLDARAHSIAPALVPGDVPEMAIDSPPSPKRPK